LLHSTGHGKFLLHLPNDKQYNIKDNENLYYLSFADRGSVQFTKCVTHIFLLECLNCGLLYNNANIL